MLRLTVIAAMFAAACGGKVAVSDRDVDGSSEGAGAAGDSATGGGAAPSAGSGSGASGGAAATGAASTADGTASSSSGVVRGCDAGSDGGPGSVWCQECELCALGSICAGVVAECNADDSCVAYYECKQSCVECDQCDIDHADGVEPYQAVVHCLRCACVNDCNATCS